MNGISSQCAKLKMYDGEDEKGMMIRKPGPLRTVSWSENVEETDLDIPGTPRTPRTSTTPGSLAKVNSFERNIYLDSAWSIVDPDLAQFGRCVCRQTTRRISEVVSDDFCALFFFPRPVDIDRRRNALLYRITVRFK